MTPSKTLLLSWCALSLQALDLVAGTPGKHLEPAKIEAPEESEWTLKLALPAWLASTWGDSGVNGNTSHSKTGFNEIVNKIDMAAAFRAELWKGRFGVLADFSYFSISDSIGVDRAIRKVDIQADEML